jgi:hypothetical protein
VTPATQEDREAFETDVLAGYVLARAAAGIADSTISNDMIDLQQIRDWFGRPLWEMEPPDADAYFGRVTRDLAPTTRRGKGRRPVGVLPVSGAAARCRDL